MSMPPPSYLINFDLALVPKAIRVEMNGVMSRVALHAQKEAFKNSPRSPEPKRMSKTLIRRRRSLGLHTPGDLERSIQSEVVHSPKYEYDVCVFVPRNAPAAAYAHYIHDMKGILWFRRGAGTVKKGQRADEKYILRALNDNRTRYLDLINRGVKSALRERNIRV